MTMIVIMAQTTEYVTCTAVMETAVRILRAQYLMAEIIRLLYIIASIRRECWQCVYEKE